MKIQRAQQDDFETEPDQLQEKEKNKNGKAPRLVAPYVFLD
jgi:hypothetical protein